MNTEIKSTLFAAFLVATNWHWSRAVENAGTHSSTTLNLDGAGIGVVICVVGLVVYSRWLYRLLRDLLDRGIRIPAKAKFVSPAPMLTLIFLLFSFSSSSTKPMGTTTITTTFGYGSGASGFLIIVAILLLTVYQFYRGLKEYAKP